MAKFKKGDRVRVIKLLDWHKKETDIRIGDYGIVNDNSQFPMVMFERKLTVNEDYNTGENTICCTKDQLELVTDSKLTNTITLILGNTAYEITGENITIKTKEL